MCSLYSRNLYENGYWIINLFVFVCHCNAFLPSSCKEFILEKGLPEDWPCDWNNGIIPYAFNFYSQIVMATLFTGDEVYNFFENLKGPKRLIGLVKRGHEHLEKMSCLKFKEVNPVKLARTPNITYLYYTYSGVLESCCLDFYTNTYSRRLVLITPMCTMGLEVAHVTLHGMGLWHRRQKAFPEAKARAVLLSTAHCQNMNEKVESFDGKI